MSTWAAAGPGERRMVMGISCDPAFGTDVGSSHLEQVELGSHLEQRVPVRRIAMHRPNIARNTRNLYPPDEIAQNYLGPLTKFFEGERFQIFGWAASSRKKHWQASLESICRILHPFSLHMLTSFFGR